MGTPSDSVIAEMIAPTTIVTRRVAIYEADGVTPWVNDNGFRLIDGAVSVDYGRAERRTIDLTLENTDGILNHDPNGFWYDKVIKVFRGAQIPASATTPTLGVLSGLQLWLKADVLALTDGSAVSSWPDSSGNGNTMTQATSSSQPVFKTNILNGNPVVRFDGSDFMQSVLTAAPAAITVLAVVKATDFTGTRTVLGCDTTGGFQYRFDASTGLPRVLTQNATTIGVGSVAPAAGAWVVVAMTYTVGSTWTHQINGLDNGSGTSSAPPSASAVRIGSRNGGLEAFLGDMAEVLVYHRVLTATELQTVSLYLGNKYNLPPTSTPTPTTWETQIGEYVIDTIRQANFPHTVRVTGRDYTKRCLLSKFKQATTFTAGNEVDDVIKAMALNAGVTKFVFPADATKVLTRDAAFERGTERWTAMAQLANDYNYELFFDAQGYLVLRDFQDPLTSPLIWTFKTGVDGTLVDYEKVTNDSRIYNSVIVTGSAADGTLVWAQATNTEPSSPTRIARLGERNYFYTSGFITTTQQAQDVANSFLKIHALEEYELNLSSVVLPWLEVGGIIGFTDPNPSPGDPDRYLLTTLNIPLGLGAMTATGKRVTVVK